MYKLQVLKLITIALIYIIIYNYKNIINILENQDIKHQDLIKTITNTNETKLRFAELKKMLNIKNKYESIFTNKGEKIIIWKNNNYLHMFFNEITNNIKYIVVKTKDIFYTQNKNETISLNIKNKKIDLRKDALTTLQKYL